MTLRKLALSFFCFSSLALSSYMPSLITEATAETKVSANSTKLWNLQDADILSIINEVSQETGKNFVVDPRVTGKISLISSKPINANEVYQVFLSVLELLGYSAIPSGNIIKIVPNVESGEVASTIGSSKSPGKGDEVVVRIIPLENISASQILPVLRPMLPQWSNISAYTPGNVLILMGHAANLQRVIHVIQDIDASSSNSIQIITLHQASAEQVAGVLNNLQNAARMNGDNSPISIGIDERTNSILLGGSKASRLRFTALIMAMDKPMTGNQGNTEVIYLRYLQAKTLAPVLGKIADNISKTLSTESNPATPANYSGRAKNAPPKNETSIQAESNTNALVITAAPGLMKAIKSVIQKLDIRPAQVLVEAIIVEVNQDDLNNLGIQWGSQSTALAGMASTAGALSSVTFPPLGAGNISIMPNVQLRSVLNTLESKSGVNVLSTPSIVVLDNQKALLKVGKEVPQRTGEYATTGNATSPTPFNTFGSKQVALQLEVTPQINLGKAVRLKIKLINDSLQNPENPGLNPIINTSQIENSVLINSDDVVVLGGLISSNILESTDKIPFLSDIPILGLAFQHKIKKLEKKNLIVFLKPLILHDQADAATITNSKYNDIRQTQIDWPTPLSSIGEQKRQNILPLWKNKAHLPQPFESVN